MFENILENDTIQVPVHGHNTNDENKKRISVSVYVCYVEPLHLHMSPTKNVAI